MLAENLRLVRVARGLSQAQLARAAGTPDSQRYISRLERGLRPSRPEHVTALARALGVDPGLLTGKPLVRLPDRAEQPAGDAV